MYHNKISAKTTMNLQPIDLRNFSKIIKSKSRTITTDGTYFPLRKVMQKGHKKLYDYGRLKLFEKKMLSIIDYTSSLPQAKGEACSSDSINSSLVHVVLN